mmetsp:Transcript_19349/g.49225  ORF Transcript_19349/g.49225 Transcript_19349/m.49225 type:complete len:329 (+) Transcript_19349:263-1249(+)
MSYAPESPNLLHPSSLPGPLHATHTCGHHTWVTPLHLLLRLHRVHLLHLRHALHLRRHPCRHATHSWDHHAWHAHALHSWHVMLHLLLHLLHARLHALHEVILTWLHAPIHAHTLWLLLLLHPLGLLLHLWLLHVVWMLHVLLWLHTLLPLHAHAHAWEPSLRHPVHALHATHAAHGWRHGCILPPLLLHALPLHLRRSLHAIHPLHVARLLVVVQGPCRWCCRVLDGWRGCKRPCRHGRWHGDGRWRCRRLHRGRGHWRRRSKLTAAPCFARSRVCGHGRRQGYAAGICCSCLRLGKGQRGRVEQGELRQRLRVRQLLRVLGCRTAA